MAFADPEELAAYLSTTFDPSGVAQAQMLLDIATAEIQGYTGQRIELVTDDEITLDVPSGLTPAFLPELPVVEVTAVNVDGSALTSDEYAAYKSGVLYRVGARWATLSNPRNALAVTYTHGHEDVPADVKGVCLSLAGRLLEGKNGFTVDSEGNPANASTVARAGEIDRFTDEERSVMDGYRIMAVA